MLASFARRASAKRFVRLAVELRLGPAANALGKAGRALALGQALPVAPVGVFAGPAFLPLVRCGAEETGLRQADSGTRRTASGRGRHHRPRGHHPHPRPPGPQRRTRPPIPEPALGPTPILRPRHGRAASVARSRSAPRPRPDPGPLGVPAAHRPALAARFSPEPGPRRVPNTPHSPGARPRPPTRSIIDAPTHRPDTRTDTKELLSVWPFTRRRHTFCGLRPLRTRSVP